ncbi:hypothetical protein K432DRAFT_386754 [Lepidopterella palustris CBS 459.81]|uniref:Uncharacterized protein n=1 Tax=Lepidopterella palustris CBS 459.81 TaxID=1314670 RepID=A0A8E2J9R3_9PEZI|nr:hypothetical protein K432DRAFT_386754 [Lepidopterella palustris CBS 459.81]
MELDLPDGGQRVPNTDSRGVRRRDMDFPRVLRRDTDFPGVRCRDTDFPGVRCMDTGHLLSASDNRYTEADHTLSCERRGYSRRFMRIRCMTWKDLAILYCVLRGRWWNIWASLGMDSVILASDRTERRIVSRLTSYS